jgi:hypothetical protein
MRWARCSVRLGFFVKVRYIHTEQFVRPIPPPFTPTYVVVLIVNIRRGKKFLLTFLLSRRAGTDNELNTENEETGEMGQYENIYNLFNVQVPNVSLLRRVQDLQELRGDVPGDCILPTTLGTPMGVLLHVRGALPNMLGLNSIYGNLYIRHSMHIHTKILA